MNLIDRQAAIDALRECENHAINGFYRGIVKAKEIIAYLPSAERKKGKWIHIPTSRKSEKWRCSVCGGRAYYPHRNNSEPSCAYELCPYYGADMREDLKDE